eukprot:TRINITY_DN18962_c0_g1_i2.p1 TRINITY_DN18962_c0_g1~~TRINITY_DN18962_c0_g1_i2.p1  ORF type:complete len:254 (-),score=50.21 TRINITY_DN18962_c0_g1_i2:106-867(-)
MSADAPTSRICRQRRRGTQGLIGTKCRTNGGNSCASRRSRSSSKRWKSSHRTTSARSTARTQSFKCSIAIWRRPMSSTRWCVALLAGSVLSQALRSHLMNVEALTTLQHSRLLAMESHFERDMKMIEEEFCSEFEDMKSTHKRTAKEMRDVNEAIKEEIERQEQELRTDFEGLQADYRGKHEEEKQVMKVTLENAVNEFERQLDNAYNTYYDSTKKQTEKYRELQNKDQKDSRKIDAMQRKCAKLTELSLIHI